MTPEKGTTSVLASLTASVMEEKVKASKAQLTPVIGEGAAVLPNDVGTFMSNERLRDHSVELRKFAADAIAIADGLDAMVGVVASGEKPVSIDAARKQKEFEADLAAKARDAEAATFKPEPEPEAEEGWRCPLHGKVIDKVSNKSGREYRGCPDCNLFERR